jgi:hypothetical protein
MKKKKERFSTNVKLENKNRKILGMMVQKGLQTLNLDAPNDLF